MIKRIEIQMKIKKDSGFNPLFIPVDWIHHQYYRKIQHAETTLKALNNKCSLFEYRIRRN